MKTEIVQIKLFDYISNDSKIFHQFLGNFTYIETCMKQFILPHTSVNISGPSNSRVDNNGPISTMVNPLSAEIVRYKPWGKNVFFYLKS